MYETKNRAKEKAAEIYPLTLSGALGEIEAGEACCFPSSLRQPLQR